MSGLDLLRDEDLRTEREEVKEPAKRWFNWWRVLVDSERILPCPDCGALMFKGDVTDGCCGDGYVSRDVAETHAAELLRSDYEKYGFFPYEWLGAFPEGERP